MHPTTHRDFIWLSNAITEKTRQYVSPTTLKRLWGYIHENSRPSKYTLNVLSRYLDFADYECYCNNQENKPDSNFLSYTYGTEDLSEGDEFELTWEPVHKVILRYMGNNTFKVIASLNAKFCVGDQVQTLCLIEGEPVTFSNVIHNGKGPYGYTAGKISGIHIKPVNKAGITPPVPAVHRQIEVAMALCACCSSCFRNVPYMNLMRFYSYRDVA